LSSVNATSGASVNLNLQFQANLDYMFILDEIINPAQGTANLCCEYGYGSTPTYQTSGYYIVRYGGSTNNPGYSYDIGELEYVSSSNTFDNSFNGNIINGRFKIISPATSTRPLLMGNMTYISTGSTMWYSTFTISRDVASGPISALRFYWSNGGSFSGGKIYIYTLAKS
jgi:hypothetical protein